MIIVGLYIFIYFLRIGIHQCINKWNHYNYSVNIITASEYAIRLKLNGMRQFLVCIDDVKLLVENRNTIRKCY
jgi:hypothetical protein